MGLEIATTRAGSEKTCDAPESLSHTVSTLEVKFAMHRTAPRDAMRQELAECGERVLQGLRGEDMRRAATAATAAATIAVTTYLQQDSRAQSAG
jgi:hypothetical protein